MDDRGLPGVAQVVGAGQQHADVAVVHAAVGVVVPVQAVVERVVTAEGHRGHVDPAADHEAGGERWRRRRGVERDPRVAAVGRAHEAAPPAPRLDVAHDHVHRVLGIDGDGRRCVGAGGIDVALGRLHRLRQARRPGRRRPAAGEEWQEHEGGRGGEDLAFLCARHAGTVAFRSGLGCGRWPMPRAATSRTSPATTRVITLPRATSRAVLSPLPPAPASRALRSWTAVAK